MQDLESQRTSLDEKTLNGTGEPSISDSNYAALADATADTKDGQIGKKGEEEDEEEIEEEEEQVPSADDLYPVTDLDKGIVGWDSQEDPANPKNFAESRKWGLLALMSSMTLVSPLASSMFSPAVSDAAADLKVTNETLLSFSITIYLLGYTVSLITQLLPRRDCADC